MKFKEMLMTAIITSVLVSSLFFVFIQGKTKNEAPQVAGETQSTADHHGGSVQISSETFGKLLNKEAPDFTLESYEGEKISLEKLRGKNVVLFFSEGLMCYPACWDQIAAFGKDQKLNSQNIVTFTIVNDRREDWKTAVDKMPELAAAQVLFDTDRSVSIDYGVLTLPSSMHRGQLAGHTYVIVDREGIVRYVLDDPQMAIRNQELISEIGKL